MVPQERREFASLERVRPSPALITQSSFLFGMVQSLEHAVLRVTDLDAASRFFRDVMGLVELEPRDGTVYLGCGLDDRFDLALVEGGTGLDHVAIRTTEAGLDAIADRHGDAERSVDEPGHERGLRFELPSGVDLEFVAVVPDRYQHVSDTALADRQSIAPVDADHVNLATTDVRADVEFLRDTLGFDVSEVQRDADSGRWELVFTRYGDYHHDVALTLVDDPDATLHHFAFTMASTDHLKAFIDHLVRHDVELEAGVSRHRAGNNVFAYFWAPGGNRIELSAEMAQLSPDTETVVRDETFTFTSWGGIGIPDSFSKGS